MVLFRFSFDHFSDFNTESLLEARLPMVLTKDPTLGSVYPG
jgi:hypothetical protein